MDALKKFREIGIRIPQIPNTSETKEVIENLQSLLDDEFKKMLEFCRTDFHVSDSALTKAEKDYNSSSIIEVKENVSDEKLWNDLHIKWLRLNKKFFKLQNDLANTGCDQYDMKYIMQSELYQFLHEDMDKRRKRLETPILQKIDAVNQEIAEIDAEQEKLTTYSIASTHDQIYDHFLNIFINILSKYE